MKFCVSDLRALAPLREPVAFFTCLLCDLGDFARRLTDETVLVFYRLHVRLPKTPVRVRRASPRFSVPKVRDCGLDHESVYICLPPVKCSLGESGSIENKRTNVREIDYFPDRWGCVRLV